MATTNKTAKPASSSPPAPQGAGGEAKGGKAGYLVLSPLRLDGERYQVDDVVELTDAEAVPLLASGVVAEHVKE